MFLLVTASYLRLCIDLLLCKTQTTAKHSIPTWPSLVYRRSLAVTGVSVGVIGSVRGSVTQGGLLQTGAPPAYRSSRQ